MIDVSEGSEMNTRRAGASIVLAGVVLLGGFGCTSEPEKGVPVEETEELWAAADKKEGRSKPIASNFDNPEQGCALVMNTEEFRVTPNLDVLAECQEDYGVTLENAPERFQQGVDKAIPEAEGWLEKRGE